MKKLLFILPLTLLASCSTELKYHMTNHRFLTPETKGAFLKGDVSAAYQLNQKVILASAYDSIVFNLPTTPNTDTAMEGTSEFNLPITLGLLKRLDFYMIDEKYGLKFQFVGSPEAERSTGWKAAIAASYGSEENDSAGVTFTSGNSTRTYDTKIKLENNSVQLIVGNRLEENFLLYLTLVRDYYKYNGTLTSNQFSALNVSGHSTNYGSLLGFNLQSDDKKHPVYVKVEGGVMKGKLDKNNARTAGTIGGAVGWGW